MRAYGVKMFRCGFDFASSRISDGEIEEGNRSSGHYISRKPITGMYSIQRAD